METKEFLQIKGKLRLWLRDPAGRLKAYREVNNLIVNAGFDFICAVIGNGTQPNEMGWSAIGTGVGAAVAGDTTLGTETGRAANTYAHTGGTKVFTLTHNFGAGVGTGAITEAGLLNAASAGTLLDRVVFAVANKLAADSLQTEFEFTLS